MDDSTNRLMRFVAHWMRDEIERQCPAVMGNPDAYFRGRHGQFTYSELLAEAYDPEGLLLQIKLELAGHSDPERVLVWRKPPEVDRRGVYWRVYMRFAFVPRAELTTPAATESVTV